MRAAVSSLPSQGAQALGRCMARLRGAFLMMRGSRRIVYESGGMNYWPGTGIKRSRNNAFDWKGKPPDLVWATRKLPDNTRNEKSFGTGGTIPGLSKGKK